MKTQPREYQTQAVDRLRQSLQQGKRRPVLMAPTGSGKTVNSAMIVEMALAKKKRVAFTVPMIQLVDQTVGAFAREGIIDVGVQQADHPLRRDHMPVQVCSIPTLTRRGVPDDIDLVIWDECHVSHKTMIDWMLANPKLPFIGLSATPWAKGMGKHFDNLIISRTIRQLISEGHLCQFEAYGPEVNPDLSGVKTTAGDFNQGQLSGAMNQKEITGDIVANWLRNAKGKRTLIFCVDRDHAMAVKEEFLAADLRAGYIDFLVQTEDRQDLIGQLERRELDVLVNIGTLTTGFDAPWLECIVLARPTKSEMLFVQMVGRGLRTHPDKAALMLLDHTDNQERLGMVTDIYHDTLDGGRKPKSEGASDKPTPKPTKCPECQFLKPPRVRQCPRCGYLPKRPSSVTVSDGDLVRLDGKGRPLPTDDEKRLFFRELLFVQQERDKSDKWVKANYREKFKEWPDRSWATLGPCIPRGTTRSWLRSRIIAWRKRKEKEEAQKAPAF